jgi:erythromycin esterase-like protein
MADTVDALAGHLSDRNGPARVVVWAHNSHVGDARATELGAHGELTLGQLVRQRWGSDCVSIGFTTHSGTVTAASEWGGEAERKRVRPALAGSWEAILHEAREECFFLPLADDPSWRRTALLERAIGVIYRPETERSSHWFHAQLAAQFDAVVHLDRTTATEPLERTSTWDRGEAPETYPTGL